MKGKVLIGSIAVVGIGAGIYYYMCKRKKKENSVHNEDVISSSEVIHSTANKEKELSINNAIDSLIEQKRDAAMSIKKRHEEATMEIKDSLDSIFNDSSIDKTENSETLNKMMNDLDRLLD